MCGVCGQVEGCFSAAFSQTAPFGMPCRGHSLKNLGLSATTSMVLNPCLYPLRGSQMVSQVCFFEAVS